LRRLGLRLHLSLQLNLLILEGAGLAQYGLSGCSLFLNSRRLDCALLSDSALFSRCLF
jgi:hypothetical protein